MHWLLALIGIVMAAAAGFLAVATVAVAAVLWLATLLARYFDLAVRQVALVYLATAYALFRLLMGILAGRVGLPVVDGDWIEPDEAAPEPPPAHIVEQPMGAAAGRSASRRRGTRR